ncbi:RNA-directed DNA polymerase, eukaryota, Reverse transcriptase zinc-binding domain protein [Artemisia annua]|uniref:RNA-directed DNA polymerase, eukaryota, Reverse transcriptase zinc-binding domain protein n=1 Tax=Artemisia annua TaxID=35608 RepID=A0A2U1KXT2_ARTAN|nr:RNA-directed DNA polymerase, eukaryota, Reverse transcriptase zinc-binding domain protein [Artemisia annua]
MVMDSMTASMCYRGVGNLDYARVLVEFDAEKDLKNEIEVQYRDKVNRIKGSKKVKVLYDWKPCRCTECKVFGHEFSQCKLNANKGIGNDQMVEKVPVANNGDKYAGSKDKEGVFTGRSQAGVRKVWNLKAKEAEGMKKSVNKYAVLHSLPDDDDQELRILKDRMIVDHFLNKNVEPTPIEAANWTEDMRKYYKDKSVVEIVNEVEGDKAEDVVSDTEGITKNIEVNEVNGLNTLEKQKEIRNLIVSENLKVCAVLETRIRSKKLQVVCDKVYQGWEWISNMQCCNKGCRIVLGWDDQVVNVQILNRTSQSMFCVISVEHLKIKFFYTFVYAANEGVDRRELWTELKQNTVWDKVRDMAEIECDNRNWNELLKFLADSCVHKSIVWVVKRLTLAACVYTIWQERNRRIFKDVQRNSQEVINEIKDNVRHKLLGITVNNSANVRKVEARWSVQCKRLVQRV